MKTTTPFPKQRFFSLILLVLCAVAFYWRPVSAEPERPKPLLLTEPKDSMAERLERKITLDVRDMNIVDVIKFLALKGEFNVVISPTVDGRTTVLLNNVAIKDALDIVIISNRLAYHIDSNIISIMTSVEYEAMYGKKFSDKTEVAIIHLQYAKPSYVLAALDNIKTNVGKIIIDEDTGSVVIIDTPESIQIMMAAIKRIEKPLETIIYSLQYAKADVVADKLRSRIDAKAVGSITADERSNQLIVRAFPGRHREIEGIIRTLDEPTKEVLIEIQILQVILKPKYDVGIDWTAEVDFSDSKLKFENLFINEPTISGTDQLSGNFSRIGVGDVDVNDFSAGLRALDQVSDTKIVANPSIMAINNEEARIHIGDTVPYIISTVSGTGDNAITSEDVRFIDVGLKVNVTPTINDEGMIKLDLRPEISSVVATIDAESTEGIPQVNKTEVETSLLVQDGTTVILAGLRKEDKVHVKKGFPVLMDLPYLEKLFGRTSDSITSTEIVIFITPHVMTGKNDYTDQVGGIKPPKAYK